MRLILEPRGGYQLNPRQPSRPTIPRHRRKPLVLEVTPDDGHFERLKNREPSKSPPPIYDSEAKSPTAIFTRRMRKKGSLFAELVRGAKDGNEEDLPTGDGDSSEFLEVEENERVPLADNGIHGRGDHIDQDDPISSLSTSSSFLVFQGAPTTSTLLPNPTTIEASLTTPLRGIARLASVLNLESSRLEISLLALGILVLVVQMGALIWIGVRRRRRSAQWHQKERQQRMSEDQGQDQDHDAAANHSRFSSTAGLLLKSSFLGSSSGGQGLDAAGMMPPFLKKTHIAGQGISSSWERSKSRLGGGVVETEGNMGANTTTGTNQCLFNEVFPPPSNSPCFVRNALNLQQESGSQHLPEREDNPLGGGGTGYHHHNLVLGPPTVIPVSIPPAPKSSLSSTRGSLSSTASEFIETVRRKSSTILSETIMPPVHVQMEVLTEIGRRVSATLQSTVGSVIPRGTRERRDTGNENDHKKDDDGGGYKYPQSQYHGYGSASSGDDELSSSSNEGSGSYTPPEERYRTDLEAGRLPSSILNNPRGNRGDEASAMTSGATRRFSLNGSIATGGSLADSLSGSEGLVRRTNLHHHNPHRHHNKRVSFVEGLVSPSSSSAGESSSGGRLGGNRRHSSFTFLQRGSGASRRPGDEEMGGTVGEEHEGDDGHEAIGFGEGEVEREQRVFHLV